jgi:hypothetical protein
MKCFVTEKMRHLNLQSTPPMKSLNTYGRAFSKMIIYSRFQQ